MSQADKLAALYEEDFFVWTRDQAAALRSMAEERREYPLDFEHLAEEIEDAGDARRDFVSCGVRRIIEQLLKLEFSVSLAARWEWRDTIFDDRAEIENRLTPTIRLGLASELARLHAHARRKAGRCLRDQGEAVKLPEVCSYELDQILEYEWFPANRHGIVDDVD